MIITIMKKKISLCKWGKGRIPCERREEGGFTLIETLAVLAIVAILASVLVPTMSGFIEDARKKAYVSEAYLVRTVVQSYIIEQNANGTLNAYNLAVQICGMELGSPDNALSGILEGSYTEGAVIRGVAYNRKTCKVENIIYQVDRYEIEIKYDSDVEIRDRDD